MLLTRCRATSRHASSGSSRSPSGSTLAAPRATCVSACTPAPCDSGATTRLTSCLRGPRHQVAQMVGDDERHLPMRQHPRLRPAGGARTCRKTSTDGPDPHPPDARARPCPCSASQRAAEIELQPQRRVRRPRRLRLRLEPGIEDMHRRARGLRQIGDLRRRQAHVGRHPGSPEHPTRPHRLEQGGAVASVHQHPVAMPHARRREPGRRAADPLGQRAPGPTLFAADQAGPVRIPGPGLQQQGS